MQKIYPCLWFDTQAEEAAQFYTSVFKNSKVGQAARYDSEGAKVSGQPEGSVMTVEFTIEGYNLTALNGGPVFRFTPAISFFVHCDTKEEVDALWEKLSKGGKVLMELEEYPYSDRYGWLQDKYGVTWQIMLVKEPMKEKIVPCLLFVGDKFGKAGEAIDLYQSVFPDSKVTMMQKAPPGEPYNNPDAVMYSSFTLCGETFTAMDGPGEHKYTFNEAISLIVNCDTQKEVDHFWNKLTSDGGEEVQCGWLKDKFGVSWQIVPTVMEKMMSDKDPAKTKRVMAAMLRMKKLDIATLKEAYHG
ncbi:hypothetical protein A3D88_04760 [Candidatus Peribacteria bacterium RIFCSPHIGHO2_02_FULL_52_16]|nr:MAG: hypothetical protein A2706_03390 [Candidatus Peribacteria bacterium RIFCSPHIGHO2_01_FULL_51_35]OGJ60912.1 MAG: hypothetical protein A3D88_04760 [Candidatus Peribacteria bacterium RIFCSPHIGHO2_02_FULL_52_16]